MRRKHPERVYEDVVAPTMVDNQTWNTCPDCGKDWQDPVAIPGLIHRTRRCDDCRTKKTNSGPHGQNFTSH